MKNATLKTMFAQLVGSVNVQHSSLPSCSLLVLQMLLQCLCRWRVAIYLFRFSTSRTAYRVWPGTLVDCPKRAPFFLDVICIHLLYSLPSLAPTAMGYPKNNTTICQGQKQLLYSLCYAGETLIHVCAKSSFHVLSVKERDKCVIQDSLVNLILC